MGRERRVEAAGGARVGADGLHAEAGDVALRGQPARRVDVGARRHRSLVADVEERRGVLRALAPARPEQHPRAVRDAAVLGLEGLEVADGEQVAGVGRDLGGAVHHHRGADQPRGRRGGDVLAVAAGDPVHRRVEVRAGVLAELEHVPRPGGTGVVVAAEPSARQRWRVRERLGQLDDRRASRSAAG